jgi:hypothetical protein
MRRKSVNIVLVETNFRRGQVKIVLGHPFYYFEERKEFGLSITPHGDPTVVPIDDIKVGADSMEFTATIQSKRHRYSIEFREFPEGPILGELIRATNDGQGFNLGLSSNNDLEYESEDEGMSLRVLDRSNRVVRFFLPNRRIIFVENNTNVDGKIVNSLEGRVQLLDHSLTFFGKTVDGANDFTLTWNLDFADEIAGSILDLIKIFVCTSQQEGT